MIRALAQTAQCLMSVMDRPQQSGAAASQEIHARLGTSAVDARKKSCLTLQSTSARAMACVCAPRQRLNRVCVAQLDVVSMAIKSGWPLRVLRCMAIDDDSELVRCGS